MLRLLKLCVFLFPMYTNGIVWAQNNHTNMILMCKETEYDDLRLLLPGLPNEAREMLVGIMNERNNDTERPYFVLKYINNKLSFQKEGVDFLINQHPEEVNIIGWVGAIHIDDSEIFFILENLEERSMRTVVKIDRFTGLYGSSAYPPGKKNADYTTRGECAKIDKKLF